MSGPPGVGHEDADSGPRGGRDRRDRSTSAWAAAAVVLALGAMTFGVAAHVRATELEERVDRLETAARRAVATRDGSGPTREAGASTTVVAPVPSTSLHATASLPSGATTATPTTVGGGRPGAPGEPDADVRRAFAIVYDGSAPADQRVALVDDGSGLLDALLAVERSTSASIAASMRSTVRSVTFSSPTRASVTYTLTVAGVSDGRQIFGEARVSAGSWKVTRATVCADLPIIGATCPT